MASKASLTAAKACDDATDTFSKACEVERKTFDKNSVNFAFLKFIKNTSTINSITGVESRKFNKMSSAPFRSSNKAHLLSIKYALPSAMLSFLFSSINRFLSNLKIVSTTITVFAAIFGNMIALLIGSRIDSMNFI
uniref:Uncharacterized protein n=1 Tax=Romanomermis culicivorax TaxID=13658 RepID=A0A915KMT4_ROMCU